MSKLNKEIQAFVQSCSDVTEYRNLRYDLLDAVLYMRYRINADGSVVKTDCLNLPDISQRVQYAHDRNTKVIPVFYTASTDTDRILASSTIRTTAITNLRNLVTTNNFDGIDNNIDIINATNAITGQPNRQYVTVFMKELSEKFWEVNSNYRITMNIGHKDEKDVYDLPVIQNYVNFIMLTGYNYKRQIYTFNRTYSNAPICMVYDGLEYMASRMNKNKILLGVPYHGREWLTADDKRNSVITGTETVKPYDQIFTSNYNREWDDEYKTPWYVYRDATNKWHQGYYDDVESLGIKYDLINSEGYAGIGLFSVDQGTNRTELWQVIENKL